MLMRHITPIFLTLALITVLVSACSAPTVPTVQPVATAVQASADVAPPAATLTAGRRWLVQDADAILAELPPIAATEAAPPEAAEAATLAAWERPADAWLQQTLAAIATDQLTPPRAARSLMLLGVTLNDGLQLAAAARAAGMAVSDDAVLAAAAQRLLTRLFPLRAPQYQQDAATAQWVELWRGEADAEAVLRGRDLGAAVAERVLRYAAQDGADTSLGYFPAPDGAAGRWDLTPPGYMPPQEPHWMQVQTVAIGDPADLRVPAPPAWGSPAMETQIQTFSQAQADLSAADLALAEQWEGAAGTVTPPGMWMQIALDQATAQQTPLVDAAAIYAALGVALHDAAITCWESKYHYQFIRPVQVMQADDPAWLPPLNTPPHPSYPSGHASFSGAAAGVLQAAFPAAAADLAQSAEDAAASRIVGGIHWPIDGSAGLVQGYAVAERVLAAAQEGR